MSRGRAVCVTCRLLDSEFSALMLLVERQNGIRPVKNGRMVEVGTG